MAFSPTYPLFQRNRVEGEGIACSLTPLSCMGDWEESGEKLIDSSRFQRKSGWLSDSSSIKLIMWQTVAGLQ
eukprot:147344-Pleurochrysis_carterae.AAC.1